MEKEDKVKRLFDIIDYQLENFPKDDALCDKPVDSWRKYSTKEIKQKIDEISLGLLKMGFDSGDAFAIISGNRVEWNLIDLAILQIGGTDVPMYPNMSETDYEYIFNDSEVKLVFVQNNELYKKVKRVLPNCPTIKKIYSFEKVNGCDFWEDIPNNADESLRDKLESNKANVKEDHLATLIYTSGTTGVPKGVELTHKNILANVKSIQAIMPINHEQRMISFLPLCHIFERTATYFYMYVGGSIYYAQSIDKVGDNLKEIKPNFFTTVPRLLEKIFDKIMEKGRDLPPAKRAIFGWAVNLANHYHPMGKNNWFYNFRLFFARKLIFSKWMEALGGEVKGVICGAAALQPRLARIFTAAGINVKEGYGLTETSPVLTCNRFEEGDYYLGSVGIPIPGVQIKISDTGEILAKGDNITQGYFKKPEETEKAFDEDGWFHTGDVGEWVEGKFLKITDRVKEMFKTSGGKFITPLPIENKMKESNFIYEIMVVGEYRKFCAAIVVPNFDFILKWAKRKKLNVNTREEIAASEEIKERIWKDIRKFNKRFGHIKQIKKFEMVPDLWSVETGELTPTLKLKRRVIKERYKDLIDKIYSE